MLAVFVSRIPVILTEGRNLSLVPSVAIVEATEDRFLTFVRNDRTGQSLVLDLA